MQNDNTAIAQPSATRKRYRGWIYICMHGPEDDVWGLTVCDDFVSACLYLTRQPDGDILCIAPDEGAKARRYLEGCAPWMKIRTQKRTGNLVSDIAKSTGCSRTFARDIVVAKLEEYGGAGWYIHQNKHHVAEAFGAPI